jgi:hypothetical protein
LGKIYDSVVGGIGQRIFSCSQPNVTTFNLGNSKNTLGAIPKFLGIMIISFFRGDAISIVDRQKVVVLP